MMKKRMPMFLRLFTYCAPGSLGSQWEEVVVTLGDDLTHALLVW